MTLLNRRTLLATAAAAAAWPALASAAAPDPWAQVPKILRRIKPPSIPKRQFLITAYGAKPDADCTAAIAAAIDAASKAGGGKVIVPAGVWKTGAIHLKSKTELNVAKGATLKFSTDPAAYPVVLTRHEGIELMNFSALIYAYGQHDIAITGEGLLDGQADRTNWWAWPAKVPEGTPNDRALLTRMNVAGTPVAERIFGPGKTIRPNFVQPYRCKNVLIEGVSIVGSPMWEIHPVECTNVIVRGLHINSLGPNNDGIDPESCKDMLIEDCVFATGDDCIAIKSGRDADGRRLNIPCENIVVRNCHMANGHGGFTLGSECTGGVRNTFIENCQMDSPNLDTAFRFKNNALRGGIIENNFVRNITVGQVRGAVITVDFNYGEGDKGPFVPIFRNLVMEKVTSSKSARGLNLQGLAKGPVGAITLRDCQFNNAPMPNVIKNVQGLIAENVTINGAPFTSAGTYGA